MTDIERRLRDLGQRLQEEPSSHHPAPSMKGRIRARRFSTVTVASLVLIAVVAAGTFAAGWVGTDALPPAGPGGPYSVDVPGEVWVLSEDGLDDPSLNLAWGRDSETAQTLACVGGLPADTSHVELTHSRSGEVLSWSDNFVGDGDLSAVCAHDVEADLLVDIANNPAAHRLIVDAELEIQLVRTSSVPDGEPTEADCGPPVDFEPTYLPEGWSRVLHRGPGAGGRGYPGLLGHYGGSDIGYYDLVGGSSPFAQGNKREIEVLSRSATSGDIHEGLSVEFDHGGCNYVLIAYVFDRAELERFAEGLRFKERGEEPPSRQDFAAVWPEDIEERAGEECTSIQHVDSHWRSDPIRTAERFATDVLRWKEAQARQSKSDVGGVGVYVGNGPISSESPVVAIYVKEVFGGCWSVISVSRLPDGDPTGVSVSVLGRQVQVGFDTLDAAGGMVEVGYGGRVETQSWVAAEAGERPVTFTLSFDPDTTGHFLILFEDEEGNVFSAAGGPLPAGDFSAG